MPRKSQLSGVEARLSSLIRCGWLRSGSMNSALKFNGFFLSFFSRFDQFLTE